MVAAAEEEAEVGLEKQVHDDLLTLVATEVEQEAVEAKELEPGSCCYCKQIVAVLAVEAPELCDDFACSASD